MKVVGADEFVEVDLVRLECRGRMAIVEAIAVVEKKPRRFMRPREEEGGFIFDWGIFKTSDLDDYHWFSSDRLCP